MAWIRKIKDNFYVYERKNGVEQPPVAAGKYYSNALDIKRKLEERGGVDNKTAKQITIGLLYEVYLDHCIKTQAVETVNHKKDHLPFFLNFKSQDPKKQFKEFMLSEFARAHGKEYKSALLEKYSVNGANIKLAAIKTMFQFAIDEKEWLDVNPMGAIKKAPPVKVGRALTQSEFAVLLEHGVLIPELREILTFAVYTGLRMGEVVNLKKENIWAIPVKIKKMVNGVEVEEEVSMPCAHVVKIRKGKKIEKVPPILPPIRYMVDRVKSGPIFAGWSSGRIRYALYRAIKRAQRYCKDVLHEEHRFSGRLRFHDMRHTAATWAYMFGGLDWGDVQEFMGHTSVKTTKDIYGHLPKERLIKNMQQIDYKIK